MTEYMVQSLSDLRHLMTELAAIKLPFTVKIIAGKHRSIEQNRLQRLWCNEISAHLGDCTPEEVRAYCKLRFGVPILRAANEGFREAYDRVIKSMSYEQKLELMAEPLDCPVTRIMTTGQKTEYLNAMRKYFSEIGVDLTDPEGGYL